MSTPLHRSMLPKPGLEPGREPRRGLYIPPTALYTWATDIGRQYCPCPWRFETEHDFDQVWNDFSDKIRLYIRRRVPDQSYVDDILQDVFVKIHMHVNNLTRDSNLSSWVYTIARNTIIDFFRRREVGLIPLHDGVAAPDDTCDSPACEIASGLEDLARSLPAKYAEALLMVDFSSLSFQEAAQQLGLSVSGAKSRVQRARKMIKDSLLRCCHFVFDSFGTIIDFYPATCCCCQVH